MDGKITIEKVIMPATLNMECISKFIIRSLALQRMVCKVAEYIYSLKRFWSAALLASRWLSIYEDNQILDSLKNYNFLACVKLTSNLFMTEHAAEFRIKGRGVLSYLLSTVLVNSLLGYLV